METVVRPDMAGVAREAAERVVSIAGEAIAARGQFTMVLSGGSTPAVLYQLLASPGYAGRVDWSATDLFFGDERCVPPDHEWSNYGMVRRTLLDATGIPPARVRRIQGEEAPQRGAHDYASVIAQVVPLDDGRLPRFDLILLGMGDDGHTASLFPGMPALDEREAWVVASAVPPYVRPPVERITLTLPVLNASRNVLFLVTGEAKARTVLKVRREGNRAAELPAALVQPSDGRLAWLLDASAASLIERG